MAPYLLADRPDDGPTAPIYRSVALMRGWKMEFPPYSGGISGRFMPLEAAIIRAS